MQNGLSFSNFLRLDRTALYATLASHTQILHVDHVYSCSREILIEALENVKKYNVIISFLLNTLSTSEYVHLANHNEPKNSCFISYRSIFPVGQDFIHGEQSY